MYEIYSTIEGQRVCLYDDTVSNLSVKLLEPTLTLEDSAAGSLEFKLTPNNIAYSDYTYEEEMVDSIDEEGNVTMRTVTKTVDLVERLQSVITVFQNGEEIWEGRVLTEERDFQNIRSIYCEGELAYLNDTCQVAKRYHDITLRQFIEAVISIHNSRVDDRKKFYVGAVTISDNLETGIRDTNYEKTMEVINRIVEDNKAHLYISKVGGKRYLNFVKDYNAESPQTIQFGKNLLDFTCKWDMTEMCSVVVATGAITENGQSSTVGKPLTPQNEGGVPTWGQLLYLDQNAGDVLINRNDQLGGYCTASFSVQPNKNYYVSCRLHGGLVAYCFRDSVGQLIQYATAGSENQIGFTDFVDQKITTPAGVVTVWVCGWGTDLPVSLKDESEVVTDLDKYLTVEDCDTDIEYDSDNNPIGTWHQKGSMYVTSPELLSKYGWIERQIQFEDTDDKDELYKKAKAYLQSGQFDNLTIEVKAFDLTLLGVNTATIKVLDQVRVISPPHGIDKLFPVTKLEIPLNNPAEQTFTIGTDNDQTLTGVNNETNSELLAKVDAIPSYSSTIESAKENAVAIMAAATRGYVTMVPDPENPNQIKEIVISDVANPLEHPGSMDCWVWNSGGLGHFDHYPLTQQETGTNVAITMDGHIVADYVTAGVLAGPLIRGCDVQVGGMDNRQGVVLVKSGDPADPNEHSNNRYCVELRNGGLCFGKITGYSSGAYTINRFGYIDSHKVFTDPEWQANKNGIAMQAPVIAFDVDELWVSSSSDGNDASGTITNDLYVKNQAGQNRYMRFRHGLLIELGEATGDSGIDRTLTLDGMDLEFQNGILISAQQHQEPSGGEENE